MKFEPCLIAKVAMVAVVTCAFASAGRSLLNVNDYVGDFGSAPCWNVSPIFIFQFLNFNHFIDIKTR